MIHDDPRENKGGAEAHQCAQDCHCHSQVLPGYWDEAVKLDDAENVDEECKGEEEAPGEHAEDPECVEVFVFGWIFVGVREFQRGHKTEGGTAG